MTMETKQTTGTRELTGDVDREEREDTTRGDGERADDARLHQRVRRLRVVLRHHARAALARRQRRLPEPLWETIQTGFVDEPRQTVEQADELVAEVMKRLAEGFAGERERLEQQWGRGEDVSTEDLRVALQRYRSFFQRLLAA